MQSGGRLERFFVGAEGGGEAAGPGGYALDMCPAAGKRVLQEVAGEGLGPGGKGLHYLRLRRQPGRSRT